DIFLIIRLIISALIFAAALIFGEIPDPWPLVMLIASAVISGYDVAAGSVLAVIRGSYFDKCILILIVTVAAFSLGMATEGAALILLFQLGGSMIDYAYIRTSQTVSAEVYCRAGDAHIQKNGAEETAPAERVVPGDNIIINPGERVPCDCIVLDGGGSLDSSPLGGGTDPLYISEGDEVLSGCILKSGCLRCEATATEEDSTCASFQRAMKTASDTGSPVPEALRRFMTLYTPIVVVLAVVVAGILPLIYKIGIMYAIRRALIFLIIANPCALFVALPLIRFGSIAGTAKSGVMFSSINAMDNAARAAAVVFEKTGALTDGMPHVASVKSERIDADTFLKMTAHALAYSDSPIANSVISSYGGTIYIELIGEFKELPGMGIEVYVDGVRICAGNLSLMAEKSINVPETDITTEQAVYVSIAQEYAGRILLTESLREDAAEGIADLAGQGITSVILLTDEHPAAAAKTASELKIKEYYSDCGREQQLATVKNIKQSLSSKNSLILVGGKDIAESEHSKA
ncbi:MAG: HAD family hydrolase, partial [Clostridia bacterium]|nr:HAD family hydrolase [Clostridia bacterium]